MIGRKPVPHWLWLTKYPSSRRTTSEEIDVEVTRGLSREDWRVKSIRAGNDGAEKKKQPVSSSPPPPPPHSYRILSTSMA